MQTGGWKTKNWSDFTCYSSDGRSALAMEPIQEEIHRWSLYGTGPGGLWGPGIHNMEHGVFMARWNGELLQGDILQMELQGDTLRCAGELRVGERVIAECEARIRLRYVEGMEVYSIAYRYEFHEEGPFEVLQQYDTPMGSPFAVKLLVPEEGGTLTWETEHSSMRATFALDQPVDKRAEFEIGFHVATEG